MMRKIDQKDFNAIILFRRIKYLPAISGVMFFILGVVLLMKSDYPTIINYCFFLISLLCIMCSSLIYVYDNIIRKYISE